MGRWALLMVLAGGCGWFGGLPEVRLDGDTVREIADAIGLDGATVQFELRCTVVEEVATCDVVGSTTVIPGDLATRIAKDIGTDALAGKDFGLRCTVAVADPAATTCEVDLGNGWQEVPVDGIGTDPGDGGDVAPAPPARGVPDRGGKASRGGKRPGDDGGDRAGGRGGDRAGDRERSGGDRARGGDGGERERKDGARDDRGDGGRDGGDRGSERRGGDDPSRERP